MSEEPHQLDLFTIEAGTASPSGGVAPGPHPQKKQDPATARAAMRAHFAGPAKLPIRDLVATVEAVARKPAEDDAGELLIRVCAAYGPWDAAFGPYGEVRAALEGLARLPRQDRRRAARTLSVLACLPDGRLPPVLRTEVAAVRIPDLDPLRACLRDPDPEIRREACQRVRECGASRLIPELQELMQDPVDAVAATALRTRGDLGDVSARTAIGDRVAAIAGSSDGVPGGIEPWLDALLPVATRETAVRVRRLLPGLGPEDRAAAEAFLAEL